MKHEIKSKIILRCFVSGQFLTDVEYPVKKSISELQVQISKDKQLYPDRSYQIICRWEEVVANH